MNAKCFTSICIAFAVCLTISSCQSKRTVSSATAEKTDIAQGRTETIQSDTADSLFRSLLLSFDTLDVWIDTQPRDSSPADRPRHNVRLRAVRGALATRQQHTSAASSSMTATDTVSVTHSASGESRESTTDTSVYSPPDLTWIFGIAIVLISAGALIIYRIRRK